MSCILNYFYERKYVMLKNSKLNIKVKVPVIDRVPVFDSSNINHVFQNMAVTNTQITVSSTTFFLRCYFDFIRKESFFCNFLFVFIIMSYSVIL